MARGLSRTSLNSSRLVRLLADYAVTELVESKQTFADRLGQWLGFTDAIALFAALGGNTPAVAAPTSSGADVREQYERVRTVLTDAIINNPLPKPGSGRIKLPASMVATAATTTATANTSGADFSPYHRYYLAQQRGMGAGIGPLRVSVRAVVAAQSPALKQLAGLDAVFEQALLARERDLLATLPFLLAKRFEHLYQAHLAARAPGEASDDPEQWMQAGGWLATYCRDMQAVLLAELEVRLQPVAGLIAALGNEVKNRD